MGRFRRLTPQQRATLAAIKRLKVMTVTPQDARPLRALQRRRLVRYSRDELGVRLAIYRGTAAARRVQRRTARALKRAIAFAWSGLP